MGILAATSAAVVALVAQAHADDHLRSAAQDLPAAGEIGQDGGDTLPLSDDIVTAIVTGDLDGLAKLFGTGADLDRRLASGDTALAIAAATGRLDVVHLLIDAGADADARSAGGRTPLMIAVAAGQAEVAEALIREGADVLATDDDGLAAGELALQTGDPDLMEVVAAALPEPAVGADAFLRAAETGDTPVLEAGIGAGLVSSRDEDGWTALMLATAAERADAVGALLEAGGRADDASEDGITLLMIAAVTGNEAIAMRLLRAGADVTAKNGDGLTAIDVAEIQGHGALAAAFRADLNPPPERIRDAQEMLARRGYDPGPADGVVGAKTRDAIARYMADHGLGYPGAVSAALLHHLRTGSPASRRTYGLAELGFAVAGSARGLAISRVEPGTPAAAADLREGDVLIEVGRHEVTSAAEIEQAIGDWMTGQRRSVLMLVERRGDPRFVAVTP